MRPLNGIVVGFTKHDRNKIIILCENGNKLTTRRTKKLRLGGKVEIFLEADTLKVTKIRRALSDREELEENSIQPKLSKTKGDISDQDYYDRQERKQITMVGTCPSCKERYYGWALQEERHQHCDKCGEKLIITRDKMRKNPARH